MGWDGLPRQGGLRLTVRYGKARQGRQGMGVQCRLQVQVLVQVVGGWSRLSVYVVLCGLG